MKIKNLKNNIDQLISGQNFIKTSQLVNVELEFSRYRSSSKHCSPIIKSQTGESEHNDKITYYVLWVVYLRKEISRVTRQ